MKTIEKKILEKAIRDYKKESKKCVLNLSLHPFYTLPTIEFLMFDMKGDKRTKEFLQYTTNKEIKRWFKTIIKDYFYERNLQEVYNLLLSGDSEEIYMVFTLSDIYKVWETFSKYIKWVYGTTITKKRIEKFKEDLENQLLKEELK